MCINPVTTPRMSILLSKNCFIIYIGCRYCLMTNIIFGATDQSQCWKCGRISLITFNIVDIATFEEFVPATIKRINVNNHKKIE